MLILIILLIIILITSCKELGEKANTESLYPYLNDVKSNSMSSDNVFEFTSNSFFFSPEYEREISHNQVSQSDWVYYLEQMYGVKVIYHSNYFNALNYSYETYIKQVISDIKSGSISGLFRVLDLKTLKTLIEQDLILPMNDYLELCSNVELIPMDWVRAYSIDGEIWGLPSQMSLKTKIRYIRNDWLENLNIIKPATITEFYDAMKAFTYNDPDQDGLDNTCGFSHQIFNGIEDIFGSFDVRLNYQGQLVPTWNPNSNKWEDSFLKPEMKECLYFLKQCAEEKILLEYSTDSDDIQFSKGYAGSTYSLALRDILAKKSIHENRPSNGIPSIDYIFGLKHKIDSNISCYYMQYYSPIILTKSSVSPSTTFSFFVDSVICDLDCFMHTNYYLDSNQYSVDENNFLSFNLSEEELNNYISPNLLHDNPIYQFKVKQNYDDETKTQAIMERFYIDQQALENSLCYQVPQFVLEAYMKSEYTTRLYEVSQLSIEIFSEVMNNTVSIEDAMERYGIESKKLDIDIFVEMQNYILH
ncbi:MAG: hypothetical protein JW903_01040 [Clostridia bacterium]|nr:hypothetical protein [Clostridia bacterium]